jgi:REP element-mobilizing transposase RayT
MFLNVLGRVVTDFNWLCHAYCIMTTHYHLLIETPEGNLSAGTRQLNGVYTQRFHRRHRSSGHVFQGHFKSILVDKDSYLLQLCRYILLNPVRAGLARDPADFKGSSYRAMIGKEAVPELLTTGWLLSQFSGQRQEARRKLRQFVLAGEQEESFWQDLRGQCILGGEKFLQRVMPKLREKAWITEIPRQQRFADRPALSEILPASFPSRLARNEAIVRAYREYGYSQAAIAKKAGLHYSTVIRIIDRV